MTLPDPPVNVRLVVDDVEVPVSCRFAYRDAQGCNVWEVIAPVGLSGQVTALRADALPGRTGLAFPMTTDLDEQGE